VLNPEPLIPRILNLSALYCGLFEQHWTYQAMDLGVSRLTKVLHMPHSELGTENAGAKASHPRDLERTFGGKSPYVRRRGTRVLVDVNQIEARIAHVGGTIPEANCRFG
jgi:hypothetical protein